LIVESEKKQHYPDESKQGSEKCDHKMVSGIAGAILEVSQKVNDDSQEQTQYGIRNVDVVPKTSFHKHSINSKCLCRFKTSIKKMVPWIGKPYEKSNYRHDKEQKSRPVFQSINGSGINESHYQPQHRNKGQSQILNLVPKDHLLQVVAVDNH